MKTIGSRLTLLYVFAVAATVVSVFLLGRFLLERQVRGNLDAILAARFAEVSDRLSSDPDADAKDLSDLLPVQGSGMPFSVSVCADPRAERPGLSGGPLARRDSARSVGAPIFR